MARRLKRFDERPENGTAVFFLIAVLLPVLLLLFTFSIDLAYWFGTRHHTQVVLDEAARQAYRFLPYQGQARLALQRYLQAYPSIAAGVTAEVTPDTLQLTFRNEIRPVFAELLLPLIGREERLRLPVAASSVARGSVLDAFIAVDASHYLAPDLSGGLPWGDPLVWPPAYFFDRVHRPVFRGKPVDARLITQQCFNPAFSAIKRAAIHLHDYLSSFRLNAVGAGVYPGARRQLDIVHPVSPGDQNSSVNFEEHQSEIAPGEFCAAAAERENLNQTYRFPPRQQGLPPLLPAVAGQWLTLPPDWSLNRQYLPYLSVREALWSRAVHQLSQADFAEALSETVAHVASAPVLAARGGLRNDIDRSLIFFAGDVPWVRGVRFPASAAALADRLRALADLLAQVGMTLKIYYALLYWNVSDPGAAAADIQALKIFARQHTGSVVSLEVFAAANEQALVTEISGALALKNRSVLLSH